MTAQLASELGRKAIVALATMDNQEPSMDNRCLWIMWYRRKHGVSLRQAMDIYQLRS